MNSVTAFRRIALWTGLFAPLALHGMVNAGAFSYRFPSTDEGFGAAKTVVGYLQAHTVAPKETLLDIARNYGLGFNEIDTLYPQLDPWLLEPGLRLTVPTLWVLPPSRNHGVVINLPEMRLYRFFPGVKMVKSYPIGIGDHGWETPTGTYRAVEREVYPTWVIPRSIRRQYDVDRIPPGPDNPLGKYWIGLSRRGYGIHGTNFPWGVGRLVSHGCIRLYPEHIEQLFQEVPVGTPVEIIYEPVKIGLRYGEIFAEVHPDMYGRVPDLEAQLRKRLQESSLWEYISKKAMKAALTEANGVPVSIGRLRKGGEKSLSRNDGNPILSHESASRN